MTEAEIRLLALDILAGIAPEADLAAIADDDVLREVLDLDSMDFLNFVTGLHKATAATIPEKDYHYLFTLAGVVAYLAKAPK